MKIKLLYSLTILVCAIFILCGCNESGRIWERYCSESFCAILQYERGDATVCVKVNVLRAEDTTSVTAEFSSPDALRGAVGTFEQNEYRLTRGGISIAGEAAKELLDIPVALAANEALSFEKFTESGKRLISAGIENGNIVFDVDTQTPVRADIGDVRCNVITFSWT